MARKSMAKIAAVVFGFLLAPAFIAAEYVPGGGLNGIYEGQFVGGPCAVRVYHTNFRFPPEGGKIVQAGDEFFFVRTYRPGCENAGAGLPVMTSSVSSYNPLQVDPRGSQYYVNQNLFPSVSASPYGYTMGYNGQPAGQNYPNYYSNVPTSGTCSN